MRQIARFPRSCSSEEMAKEAERNKVSGNSVIIYGLRNSRGELYNGSKYIGNYKNDKRDGKGIYYFNSGNRYEGEWKNGKREGKGIFYYNDGDREMGDYLNGKQVGKHVTLTINGEVKTYIYN